MTLTLIPSPIKVLMAGVPADVAGTLIVSYPGLKRLGFLGRVPNGTRISTGVTFRGSHGRPLQDLVWRNDFSQLPNRFYLATDYSPEPYTCC